ncbi:MAG: DUF4352 domain-containing protein [Proteobacteria bacterium]|nr:DUF4352 domain-containing protein [Pseudomonadota bacterium]
MSQRISMCILSAASAACLALAVVACGDDDAQPVAPAAQGAAAPAAAAAAQPAAGKAPDPAAVPAGEDPEKECRTLGYCERKCESECAAEERDRTAFYNAKRARVGESPFEVKVERVFFTGACHRGDVPEKRKATSGIKAVVEGVLTYNGGDIIYSADLQGTAFLRFGPTRYAEVPAMSREYASSWYGRTSNYSRVTRAVHGSDPWFKGESRPFHWESTAFSEAFCEVTPDEASAYIELKAFGVRGGRADVPIAVVPLRPEEVVGMALRQQVKIRTPKKGGGFDDETADAHYSKLDRMLVTRLTGKTEWLKRTSIVQTGLFDKGPAAAFPIEGSSSAWKVTVTGVSGAKEFGGYAPKGEDQFLLLVDLSVANTGADAGPPKKLSPRLEVEPGKWQSPVGKAVGQLDLGGEVAGGGSASGKLVFPRQRFERPFRLEVKTPDGATLYLDVLSYDLGPERG